MDTQTQNYLQHAIQEHTTESIRVSYYSGICNPDRDLISRLHANTQLSTTKATEHSIKFLGTETNTTYAEANWFEFQADPISYISWIEVHKDIRKNGIATLLRKELVETLSHTTIYSKIKAPELHSVAINQGFKQIQHGPLEDWFVREPTHS